MAYVLNDNQEEQESGVLAGQEGQGIANPQQAGGPVQLSQSGGSIEGAQGSAGNEAAQAASTSSQNGGGAGFTNISQYLQQNADQAGKLANKVGGYVTGQGDTARSTLNDSTGKFNKVVDDNTVQFNQGLFNEVNQSAAQVAADQAKAADVTKQRTAEYKGPSTFEDTEFYNPAYQAIETAKTSGANTQTDEGRKQLLSQIQQSKRANAGVTSLNNLLLSNDENARNILNQANAGLSDLDQRLLDASNAAKARAAAAGETTAATKKAANESLGNTLGGFKTDVDARTSQTLAQAKAQQDAVKAALSQSAVLNADQLKNLGITQAQYDALRGDRDLVKSKWGDTQFDDFSKYLTTTAPDASINRNNVATAEDYARLQALNQLMGGQDQFLSDASLAGTANLDTYDLNFGGAQSDISTARGGYERRDAQAAADRAAAERRAAEERAAAAQRDTVTGAAVGYAVAGPVGAVIGGAICFAEGTDILMDDWTYKKVENLKIGDMTAYGGMVLGKGEVLSPELYLHNGTVRLTGTHAIFEDGAWIRAKDSKNSVQLPLSQPVVVYPIINENHFLISDNDQIYADFIEVDYPGASDADKLTRLNEPEHLSKTETVEQQIELSRSWRKSMGTLRRVK